MADPQASALLLAPATTVPYPDPETAPYWDAARGGRLLIKSCDACDAFHWYPRAACPHCGSPQTRWRESAGEGEVYSFSITRKSPVGPYALAYVTLREGVSILTNLVDVAPETIAIGMRVRARFAASTEGVPVLVFAPA